MESVTITITNEENGIEQMPNLSEPIRVEILYGTGSVMSVCCKREDYIALLRRAIAFGG